MPLTADCNPGDSLGLVTMETSNQEKMLAIFSYSSEEIPVFCQTHTLDTDLIPVSLVFKHKVNI